MDQTTRQETAYCPDCGHATTHVVHQDRGEDGLMAFEWRDCYEGGHTIMPWLS